MKAIKLVLVALIAVTALTLAGCRSAPVYNVDDAQLVMSSDKQASVEDIGKAILRAGASLGWAMKKESDGHMVGTLILRKHMAKVDIKYDQDSYSISYVDSQNLNYDGTNIHSNYNGWVQNLQNAIMTQVNLL